MAPVVKSIFIFSLVFPATLAARDLSPKEKQLCDQATHAQSLGQAGSADNYVSLVQLTHQAKLKDGFKASEQSGIVFDSWNSRSSPSKAVPMIKPWGQGDVHVVRAEPDEAQKARGERNPLQFFVQSFNGHYKGEQDQGTQGGIFKVRDFKNHGVLCPTDDSQYSYYFYPFLKDPNGNPTDTPNGVERGDVYCVKTRDGQRYALIKVEAVCEDSIAFAYLYNGTSPYFAPSFSIPQGLFNLK